MFTVKNTIKVISPVIQKLKRESKINKQINKIVTKNRDTFSITFYDDRDRDCFSMQGATLGTVYVCI